MERTPVRLLWCSQMAQRWSFNNELDGIAHEIYAKADASKGGSSQKVRYAGACRKISPTSKPGARMLAANILSEGWNFGRKIREMNRYS